MLSKLKNLTPFFLKRYFYKLLCKFRYGGVRIGPGCFIHPSVSFAQNIFIGENSSLYNAHFGANSYCGKECTINNASIGRFCSIGAWAKVGFGTHPTNLVATSPLFYSNLGNLPIKWIDKSEFADFESITIADNVWIGVNVTILDGVKIGEGAICAAGAVVVKDVSPYTIVGGVPAKLIKNRFDPETIQKLIGLKIFSQSDAWLKKYLLGCITPENLFKALAPN